MHETTLTIRLSAASKARIRTLAEAEGRSLSAQVRHLLDVALTEHEQGGGAAVAPRSLAGALAEGRMPTLAEMRGVRAGLSAALRRRASGR